MKGYFIQYKFIIPKTIKHSSYTYQKLFRALYGYTQAVCKSNGKTYRYHRRGILSTVPYIRKGKNCVVIPEGTISNLLNFFKTGKNPTHYWNAKGDWKAVYYMNEQEIEDNDIVKAVEDLLERTFILPTTKEQENISSEIKNLLQNPASPNADQTYKTTLLTEAETITNSKWFQTCHTKSKKLSEFHSNLSKLKTI